MFYSYFSNFHSSDRGPIGKQSEPCREEVRRRLRMKALQRRKRRHVLCCASASQGVRKSLHKLEISGQSGECRWKKRSRKSNQASGVHRLKFRNRTSSSESTRVHLKQAVNGCWRINTKEKVMRKYSDSKSSRARAVSSPELKTWNTGNIIA